MKIGGRTWRSGGIGRRTTSTGALPSRKGYSNQKVRPGSSPGFSTTENVKIEDNGYSLSVSSYISFEEEKEEVDPLELKNNIHKHIFNNLKSALDIELFISDLENYSVIPLLTNIERLIKSYKNRILISRKRAEINQTSLFND